MLHKLNNGEILDGLPELKALLPSSVRKKRRLLEMAERGEQRPRQKTKIGQALCLYTVKSSSCYDSVFFKEISKLAPQWFVSKSQIADKKKKQLLDMAARGEPRPNRNHPTGRVLSNYTRTSSSTHDPIFTQKIYKLAPYWFVGQKGRVEEKKKTLLDMARKGDPRPIPDRTRIGQSLISYIKKSSKAYDPIFAKRIRKLAPHWFLKCSTK